MADNMSLRDFMARLATNYPRDHRRMREIIGEMYDDLVVDIDLHRVRIAQYEADKQSLALLRRALAADANIPTPFARALSPPLDPQAFRFTGKRRPNTPVAGALVPQTIVYSARSNCCTGNDPDTDSPILLLNTLTPSPVPGRTPLPPSRSSLHHQNVQTATTTQTTPPGDIATRASPGTNQDDSPQSQRSAGTKTSTPSKRAFNSKHGPGGGDTGEKDAEDEQGAGEAGESARDDVQEPVVNDVSGDVSDEEISVVD